MPEVVLAAFEWRLLQPVDKFIRYPRKDRFIGLVHKKERIIALQLVRAERGRIRDPQAGVDEQHHERLDLIARHLAFRKAVAPSPGFIFCTGLEQPIDFLV
jgi:hypothetical protein